MVKIKFIFLHKENMTHGNNKTIILILKFMILILILNHKIIKHLMRLQYFLTVRMNLTRFVLSKSHLYFHKIKNL